MTGVLSRGETGEYSPVANGGSISLTMPAKGSSLVVPVARCRMDMRELARHEL